MKKKIVILVSLFIVFLIALAPASLIESLMPKQDIIKLTGVSGSLWAGEINQLSARVATTNMQFLKVEYAIKPLALLGANLAVRFDIPQGDVWGNLIVKLANDYKNKITLEETNLVVKTSLLENYLPIKNVQLFGEIKTDQLDLTIQGKRPIFVQGLISWKNAELTYSGRTWRLGDVSVRMSTEENNKKIVGELLKTKNALDLKGRFSLTEQGVFEFIGSISTESEKALYQAFALFNNGKPENGRLPIKFKQKLL